MSRPAVPASDTRRGSGARHRDRNGRRPLRGRVLGAVLAAQVLTVGVAAWSLAAPVVTSSGVTTHGAVTSTKDTVGWLLTCRVSHTLADDPIVHPGVPGAAHLHDFWGNASTNAGSTYASQIASGNTAVADTYNGSAVRAGTSCALGSMAPGTIGDTGSYWAPALYANGTRVVPEAKAQLYYRAKPTLGTGFRPIPPDARIVVGNHAATSLAANPGLADGHIYWECAGDSDTHYQAPPTSCTEFLVNVVYPSCYDGRPMDHSGPNHTDNARFAYAANGRCPATHPVKVPQLSEKFKYKVPGTGMRLELSADPSMGKGMSGMLSPTYTMHADFWNTWQPKALTYLVDRCLNAGVSCGTNPVTPLG